MSIYTDKGTTKKVREYTNRIDYESFYEHKHAFWEIALCINGKITHYLNKFPEDFSEGDAILIRPDDYHYYKNITTEKYVHIDLYVNTNLFLTLCNVLAPNLYQILFKNEKLMKITLEKEQLEELKSKLDRLYLVQNGDDKDLINAVYIPLVLDFIGLFMQKYFVRANKDSSEFFDFIAKINTAEYICGPLENIVKLSNFSHGYLCKVFKNKMGVSLKTYHNQLKVSYATDLLKDKNMSVLDVSNALGYSSLSHFIKMFKTYTGSTPKKYRKEFLHV